MRIPAALQAIFTASNKGEEVYEPPKDRSAFKVFRIESGEAAPTPTFVGAVTGSDIPITYAKVSLRGKCVTSHRASFSFLFVSHHTIHLFCYKTGSAASEVPSTGMLHFVARFSAFTLSPTWILTKNCLLTDILL